MSVLGKLECIFRNLEQELSLLTAEFDGTLKPGSAEYVDKYADMPKVEYPTLDGACDAVKIVVTFAAIADAKMAVAGRAVNRTTHSLDDLLQPWLQVYAFAKSPFRLWISREKTPEKKGLFTRLAESIGVLPSEMEVGVPALDDRYLLECPQGRPAAKAYLLQGGIKESLDALGNFYMLRFDETYLKLIRGDKDPAVYTARHLGPWVRSVAALAKKLPE